MKRYVLIAAVLAVGIGTGVAYAAVPDGSGVIHACYVVNAHNQSKIGQVRIINQALGQRCKLHEASLSWSHTGPRGPRGLRGSQGVRGAAGPQGVPGPQGPPVVVSTDTHVYGPVASVTTGGHFVADATLVGTASVAAGTYSITLNAKVTPPTGGTGSVQVFPNLFLYDQAANSNFTGNLLNICSGPLEWGSNYQIDSYCSGTLPTATFASATTLYVYAFGYDSDRGAGSYILDDAELYVTKYS